MLQTNNKIKLKLDFTNKEGLLKSPYYLMNKLWNKLNVNMQMAPNYIDFTNCCKRMNMENLNYL